MKNKTFIIITTILIATIYIMVNKYALKEIKKQQIDVNQYIQVVDAVSANKVQINWKEVASIIAVQEKNDLKNIKNAQIQEISRMFLKEENNTYKLKSLETVLKNLDLSQNKKELVYDYIEDLKYYGLKPSRLKPDTKHTKFIESLKEDAIKNYKEYKILPSITIAQAILESGWGESNLSKNYNNLFGIKADKYWEGESVTLETTEYQNDKIKDAFRKYEDKGQSLTDHAEFLAKNKRYKKNGVFDANTYIYQANALQEAGYSTVMNEDGEYVYARRLIEIIKQYNLQLIDSEAQVKN